MKKKLKSKSFWLMFTGAAVLLLQLFGLKLDVPHVNEIVSAVCALLIFLGVMTDDTKEEGENDGSIEDNGEDNEKKD